MRKRVGYESSGFEVQVRPWVAIFFLLIEKLSITGQKFCVLKIAATVYERDNCIDAAQLRSVKVILHETIRNDDF